MTREREREVPMAASNVRLMLSSRVFGADYRAALRYAVAHGYGGIEWYFDAFRLPLNPASIDRFFAALADAPSLRFSFHLPTTDVEVGHRDADLAQASLEYLSTYVTRLSPECSRQPGPPCFTLHVGANSIPMEYLDWNRTIAHLSRLRDVAERAGGILCLENLKSGWTNDPKLHLDLAEASGVMITLDTGHAASSPLVRSGRLCVAGIIRQLRDRIRHVHLYGHETIESGRHEPPASWEEIRETCRALLEIPGQIGWVLELSTLSDLEATRAVLEGHLEELNRP